MRFVYWIFCIKIFKKFFRKKLEEFSFKSFGFIIKGIVMNINQGYLDIRKDLTIFLDLHLDKKNKKKAKIEDPKSFLNVAKNKITNEKTINYDEETNYRTFNQFTKIEIDKNISNTSLINFTNNNIFNVIRDSESILHDLKTTVINKSSIYIFIFYNLNKQR